MGRQRRPKSKLRNTIEIMIILCLVIGSIAGMYLNDGYQAGDYASSMVDGSGEITLPDNMSLTMAEKFFAFVPEEVKAGFIFYPGGLVDHEAYAPLMRELASQGILAVDASMPLDLAVFGKGSAKNILKYYRNIYPDLEWYMGGHSLGGVMAASYAADHEEELKGLVFLASYTTEDFSQSDLRMLSLLGSEDGVLKKDKYEENKVNFSADFTEYVIEGGCHAGFGDYGVQKGDQEPSISSEEQMGIAAGQIADWMLH